MLKNNVLRRKKDFSSIYNRGKSFASKYIVIFHKKNNLEYNRTAFLASKKVGNSVKRNKARRLMKEIYHIYKDKLKIGYDIIFIARTGIETANFEQLNKTSKILLKKTKLLIGEDI